MNILKRQAEGIEEARKAGKHFGRPKIGFVYVIEGSA